MVGTLKNEKTITVTKLVKYFEFNIWHMTVVLPVSRNVSVQMILIKKCFYKHINTKCCHIERH